MFILFKAGYFIHFNWLAFIPHIFHISITIKMIYLPSFFKFFNIITSSFFFFVIFCLQNYIGNVKSKDTSSIQFYTFTPNEPFSSIFFLLSSKRIIHTSSLQSLSRHISIVLPFRPSIPHITPI